MNKYLPAFKAAFPLTLPICAAFLFLGISYGFLMVQQGFSIWYPFFMSMLIFAGAMEFVTINLLLSAFDPLYTFFMALMINSRHLFYGISMLERFKGTGWKKPYLIFGMCDESFTINCTANLPENVDKGWFMFFVTLLNHVYWVAGAVLGGIIGSYITFNTKGLEFVLTALFITIFVSQWQNSERHFSALCGLAVTLLSLVLIGPQNFVLPALVGMTAIFVIVYRQGGYKI